MPVLFVIAPENFRDEEYRAPESILSKKGVMVLTASTTTKPVTGMLGLTVKPDLPLESALEMSFEAILLVGGNGATALWDNTYLHKLVRDFYQKKKLIGAICLAPVILARAGLLRGKRATVYETAVKELKEMDAVYTGATIEQDGLILTANGPSAANLFGQTFARILLNDL
jgi:protease I